jgi:N-acetyl-gamma-glutamyl-phosphate reductase
MDKKINIAIIGASGYTGIELIKILDNHKNAQLKYITSRTYSGKKISDIFPLTISLKNNQQLYFTENLDKENLKEIDLLFLCLPPGQSMLYLTKIINDFNGNIIDLGADFRIKDINEYEKWYKNEHILKDYVPKFIYGLCEIYKEEIKKAKYIANPGCYPTSILLALYPLLKIKELEIDFINIDSKSGVSGAGKKLKEDYLFLNLNNNFFAYSSINHRHIPEIEEEIYKISMKNLKISFTPHLLPLDRGIFSTIYINLNKKFKIKDIEDLIYESFINTYKSEIFVKFLGRGIIPAIKDVVGTNMTFISYDIDYRTNVIKIFSVLDNILKGASGQAVQNMNLMFGLEEDEGLKLCSIYN